MELVGIIIGEFYVAAEPRLQPGIGVDEIFHLLCVSCQNDHKLSPVVFHAFEQCGARLFAIVRNAATEE